MDKKLQDLINERVKRRCRTCRLKNVEKYNKAFKEFYEKTRKKNMIISWRLYIIRYASLPEKEGGLGYPLGYSAAQDHAENCLGLI